MEKLKLNFKSAEQILSKDQLKRVTGGFGSHPHCEGLGDREVYCCDSGESGTCDDLATDGCTRIRGSQAEC